MKKILVIEDSRAVAHLVVTQLEEVTKRKCDIAKTRAEALELLAQNADDYFVITADLNLPDSRGIDTIDSLASYNIPCVVLTGDMNTALQQDILSFEFVADYVVKSVPGAIEYVADYVKRLAKNQSTKVMVVDDSRVSRKIMTAILRSQMLQVIEASSAEEGIELMEQHKGIKLVITDGELGEMSGIDLIHHLRKDFTDKELAIIGFSGAYSRENLVKFLKAGANDFVSKPVLEEEMISRINRHLDYLDSINELIETTENQNLILKITAHDIRDPIASIATMSEFLVKTAPEGSREFKGLSLIKQTCDNVINLVGSLNEYSRHSISNLTMRAVLIKSMKDVITAKVEEYQTLLDKKQQVVTIDIKDADVFGDILLLGQVIGNLLSNAIKYSPVGSQINITSKVSDAHWCFYIEDQGPGILDNEVPLLFVPFSKLSNQPTGGEGSSGLGLAICKKLVDAHNGQIGYQPAKEGQGSKFFFTLPLIS